MIILNIQHWEGDKAQAMALLRLMADLEPAKRTDAYVLVTCRFDGTFDEESIAYASSKFDIRKFRTTRKATGWPNGPNQMAGESYLHCVESHRKGLFPNAEVVMFIEADCVPLRKTWISELYEEYKQSGKMITGCWLKKLDAGVEHVNGNCLMSINFWKRCKGMFWPDIKGGWDATLRHHMLPVAAPSKLIWSDYQLGMAHNPWKGCDYLWQPKRFNDPSNAFYGQDLYPAWFHGVKVMDGLECVRNRLLTNSTNEPQDPAN